MRTLLLVKLLTLGVPAIAFLSDSLIEGEDARKLYAEDAETAQVIVERDNRFILRRANGTEIVNPKSITVKQGERFYLLNEDATEHKIYDESDNDLTIQPQKFADMAAITFSDASKHVLRCDKHDDMKIAVYVVGEEEKPVRKQFPKNQYPN